MSQFRSVLIGFFLSFLLVITGTIGYLLIEHWSLLDAFYMTIITLSTVGFGEVHPLSSHGQVFTTCLIISGIGVIAYMVGSVVQFVVEGQLKKLLEKRVMKKKIEKMKNHYIVCGYGRIGREVCKELKRHKKPFIVIERDATLIPDIEAHDLLYVYGEATEDEILLKARVQQALALIATVGSDADNVYVVLTARELNPNLQIVARAEKEEAINKLRRAGANKIIAPYTVAARKIAYTVTHPLVTDFIELAVYKGFDLQLGEIPIGMKAEIKDVSLKDSGLREKFDIIVVAIRKASGEMLFNPSPNTVISPRDILVVLGKPDKLRQLEKVMDSDSVCLLCPEVA
ncbi:MAG: potassium channel protein [Candidatus Desulfofervidaceae bacterium]|nr:potassium channel protein [Candidatus Desulfofervidaceae bacterium]